MKENEILRKQFFDIVSNQIRDNDPPETKKTFDRLIKEDVVRFIQNDDDLNIWSPQYFKDLIEKIKFDNN